ncbi:MAG: AAA family ATPase [Tannerella sp.]|jgi:hypothetical protein|nr:AAA family ATPase [Tannerella sp.]
MMVGQANNRETTILWQASRLTLTGEYVVAPEILRVHGSAIGTLGNFSASIGKAKSKKTFNVSAIVAAALKNGTVLQYAAELPENKRKILYVDTEQSPYHCQKVMKRIVRMAGLPLDKEPENLDFLALRRHTPEIRIAIVEEAIYHTQDLGLVIIDGIRDMVYDINSPGESTKIISKLMQWTDERQIHIHTILHQNKADENARGHIGTELNNKAETVLEVAKDKFDGNISTVQAVHIRAMDFQPFAFRINDDALPELVEEYSFDKTKTESRFFDYSELKDGQHRQALEAAFSESGEYGYSDLVKALKRGYTAIGCAYGENRLVKLKTFLENKRMIVKDGKKYRFNPEYHY